MKLKTFLKVSRRKNSKKRFIKVKNEEKIVANLTAKCTSNNTFISSKGFSVSAGELGFKGAKRSTLYAAQQTAQFIGGKLSEHSVTFNLIVFKGFGKCRKSILKGLIKKNIKILKIIDKTANPHNGCRSPKKRRR